VPTADLAGAQIHYERHGSGPPLLMISGTGSDLRGAPNPFKWPGADTFDVVGYDHRGLGRSLPTDPDGQPTMADFAADALALADSQGWTTFSALGISFGGMVAQELALLAGDRIDRLVLCCTSSGGAGAPSYPLHELYGLGADERIAAMVPLIDTRAVDDTELRDLLTAFVSAGLGGEVSPGLVRQLEARRLHDTFERLGSITATTLVAAGRFDGIAPLSNSEALAANIPYARLEVFDGGHGFMVQDPTAWPAIGSFLHGTDSPR
jgi:3-oxoadipate enol-lactonase